VTETADVELATTSSCRVGARDGPGCQSARAGACTSSAVYDRFVSRAGREGEPARAINYPDLHEGVVGPLSFDRQADVIADQIDDAVRRGAKVLCGGRVEIHGAAGAGSGRPWSSTLTIR